MWVAGYTRMPLITLIVVIAVVGVVLWLITTYVPMQPTVKRILVGVVIFFLVIWLLQVFGLLDHLNTVRIR